MSCCQCKHKQIGPKEEPCRNCCSLATGRAVMKNYVPKGATHEEDDCADEDNC